MTGQEKTIWELAQDATYHEWSEWFYQKAQTTLSTAVGLAMAGLIDYYFGTAMAVLASVVMLIIGIVFAAGAIYLKDNHNQVK